MLPLSTSYSYSEKSRLAAGWYNDPSAVPIGSTGPGVQVKTSVIETISSALPIYSASLPQPFPGPIPSTTSPTHAADSNTMSALPTTPPSVVHTTVTQLSPPILDARLPTVTTSSAVENLIVSVSPPTDVPSGHNDPPKSWIDITSLLSQVIQSPSVLGNILLVLLLLKMLYKSRATLYEKAAVVVDWISSGLKALCSGLAFVARIIVATCHRVKAALAYKSSLSSNARIRDLEEVPEEHAMADRVVGSDASTSENTPVMPFDTLHQRPQERSQDGSCSLE